MVQNVLSGAKLFVINLAFPSSLGIDEAVAFKKVCAYLKILEKLNVIDNTEGIEVKMFTQNQLDALVSKSSNWAWMLEMKYISLGQFMIECYNLFTLYNLNKLDKNIIEIYISSREPMMSIINKLENLTIKDVEELNQQFQSTREEIDKKLFINTWLGKNVFDIGAKSEQKTIPNAHEFSVFMARLFCLRSGLYSAANSYSISKLERLVLE